MAAGCAHRVCKVEQRVTQVVDEGVVVEGGQDRHGRRGVLRIGGYVRVHHCWRPRYHARLNAGVPCAACCATCRSCQEKLSLCRTPRGSSVPFLTECACFYRALHQMFP